MTKKETQPAIVVDKVSKRFVSNDNLKRTTKLALDNVSLIVPKGEVFGFLGPNGAGKTTLIKTIIGLLTPDEGYSQIHGKSHAGGPDIAWDSSTREAKLKLGYLPERPYFHEFLTSQEFLLFHGRLLGMSDRDILDKVPHLLKKVGLSTSRDQKLKTFSKGMLQRIGFAQALMHDPDILILDEPMSGLDPVGRREVRDIILEVAATGKTIFFSTHIIHDVEVICTQVGYIQKGKLQGAGTIEELLGKTVQSMEIRFSIPEGKTLHHKALKAAKKTMDGWVIEIEADANRIEYDVQEIIRRVLDEKGLIKSVVPRRSTLEDLFFSESIAR